MLVLQCLFVSSSINLCRSVKYVLWNSCKSCSVQSMTAVCDAVNQLIEKHQLSVLLHCVHCLQTTHAVLCVSMLVTVCHCMTSITVIQQNIGQCTVLLTFLRVHHRSLNSIHCTSWYREVGHGGLLVPPSSLKVVYHCYIV